jgi:hypothetical protein
MSTQKLKLKDDIELLKKVVVSTNDGQFFIPNSALSLTFSELRNQTTLNVLGKIVQSSNTAICLPDPTKLADDSIVVNFISTSTGSEFNASINAGTKTVTITLGHATNSASEIYFFLFLLNEITGTSTVLTPTSKTATATGLTVVKTLSTPEWNSFIAGEHLQILYKKGDVIYVSDFIEYS